MKKIGFCIDSLEMGGAERLLVDIVNALYETREYEIKILTKYRSNSYFYNLIKDKIEYFYLIEEKKKGVFSKLRESIIKKKNFKNFSDKVDIIIDFLDADFYKYLKKIKDKEKITWLHLSYIKLQKQKKIDEKLKYYDKIVIIADEIKEEMEKENRNLKNIFKISNFIDYGIIDKKISSLNNKDNLIYKEDYFLTVCRLDESQKDVKTLINAFSLYQGKEDLFIVGDGKDRKELEDLVTKRNLNNRIKFLGLKNNPYPYMKHAKAFILSSKGEGLPLVLIEAIYCGTKVISSSCPTGPKEILLNGEIGELFEVGNIEQLLDKLNIISKKEYDKEKINNALLRYTKEKFLKNFKELVNEK